MFPMPSPSKGYVRSIYVYACCGLYLSGHWVYRESGRGVDSWVGVDPMYPFGMLLHMRKYFIVYSIGVLMMACVGS